MWRLHNGWVWRIAESKDSAQLHRRLSHCSALCRRNPTARRFISHPDVTGFHLSSRQHQTTPWPYLMTLSESITSNNSTGLSTESYMFGMKWEFYQVNPLQTLDQITATAPTFPYFCHQKVCREHAKT